MRPLFALEILNSEPSGAGFILAASTNLPNNGITWSFDNGLAPYGSSIQVDLSSVLNIELCISAWYQPSNASDTCGYGVAGLLSELGFAVNVGQLDGESLSVWPMVQQISCWLALAGVVRRHASPSMAPMAGV